MCHGEEMLIKNLWLSELKTVIVNYLSFFSGDGMLLNTERISEALSGQLHVRKQRDANTCTTAFERLGLYLLAMLVFS